MKNFITAGTITKLCQNDIVNNLKTFLKKKNLNKIIKTKIRYEKKKGAVVIPGHPYLLNKDKDLSRQRPVVPGFPCNFSKLLIWFFLRKATLANRARKPVASSPFCLLGISLLSGLASTLKERGWPF